MALKVIEAFMKIEDGRDPQVFRYSINNGVYQVDIAQLENDIFEDESRKANWDWIEDQAPVGADVTFWSFTSTDESDFENGFRPEQMKTEGYIFATFNDFQDELDKMRNTQELSFLNELYLNSKQSA